MIRRLLLSLVLPVVVYLVGVWASAVIDTQDSPWIAGVIVGPVLCIGGVAAGFLIANWWNWVKRGDL